MRSADDRDAGFEPADDPTATTGDDLAAATRAPDAAEATLDASDADAAQRELQEQRDKYLRLAAEFDNYRRRSTKERLEAGARAQGDLVRQLLDALDDLDRFAAVDPATATAQSVIDAVTMIGRKLVKTLGAAGLEVVNPVDAPFDPALHEALATAPAESAEQDDTVAQVYQPGYVFGGQLLRPARVVVRQWNG
jgi:molecular chaperone GrpE